MNVNQFNAALVKLDLTKTAMADMVGVSLRMVIRWSNGQWPVPVTVSLLLNLMIDTNTKPEDLRR
jgi:hypothetical protein